MGVGKSMGTIQIIVISIGLFIMGFALANLIRLNESGKCLAELRPDDPEFETKLGIIRRFNYLIKPKQQNP